MKVGFAFGDHIKTEKIKRRHYEEDAKPLRLRWYLLPVLIILAGAILFLNLFSVQIVQGGYYQQLSDSNRIRTQIVLAQRGIIFDRNNTPLVYNIPGFSLAENCSINTPQKCTTKQVSHDEALSLLTKGNKSIQVDSLRQYPYKDELSHVLGYIGQISPDQLVSNDYAGYQPDAWVGQSGIEREYEKVLHGQNGQALIEVNAMGQKMRSLGQTDPISGQNITLTIDLKLQQAVYEAAKNIQKGAIIVSKPDGEILAMVSKPSYDPNLFTLDNTYIPATNSSYKTIASILTDGQNQPLLNRVIGGVYPPGSTFKIVAAAAGLQQNIIDQNYTVEDTGVLKVGDFSFANWYYTSYGRKELKPLNVVSALARSNDIFFYKLAEKISVDKLSAFAQKMGLGSVLGIDLGGEASGVVPTTQWKQKILGQEWYLGDTYHYGIGQGYLLTTPLQVNAWTQIIANDGILYIPHLLKTAPVMKKNNILDDKTVSLIRQGMIDACNPGGVGWPLFNYAVKNSKLAIDGKNFNQVASASADYRHVSVACKTGTAQYGGDTTLPHAWITLFAPAYNPQIVVTVLKESSGEGSNEAGPIAKQILDAYFGR
ncbi:MAG TPA: penicillin-binding transpeptidase domain-containing protein [Candidatus Sulfotelmatobacter sp.]|jgi:penicillin-binding protein 2|nr:penicillin-binding transpeptidase domain-containing protein [Candidatus Sulfotelmatobacter sp.]